MQTSTGPGRDGEGDQRVSRVEITEVLLDDYIAEKRKERKINNFAVFCLSVFITIEVVWITGSEDIWVRAWDALVICFCLGRLIIHLREDKKIVHCIQRAELKKKEVNWSLRMK